MKVWQAKALYAAVIVVMIAACGGGGGDKIARSSCASTQHALAAVNAQRAVGAWCGLPAGPLVIHPALQAAADGFAADLAANITPQLTAHYIVRGRAAGLDGSP